MIDLIKKNMSEKHLSVYAANDNDAIRLKESDDSKDIRTPFFKDSDSIIYSLSYTRYVDKTQVFSNFLNDNITKRVLHVQLVSKVARTIGRALKLNEDLIEAISLGHDIGHVPFGHTGEAILNKISVEHNEGYFMHNVQGVRNFLAIEQNGRGMNLTIQVLDGILCHNGEVLEGVYAPIEKDAQKVLNEYYNCYKEKDASLKLCPMTLEGCVVRISDVIAYIGRDIEDAITIGVIQRSDMPSQITEVLGDNNSSIVNTLILDVIQNSIDKNYLQFSKDIFKALIDLRNWNYKNIYGSPEACKNREELEKAFTDMYAIYLNELEGKDYRNNIEISNNLPFSERNLYEYINLRSEEYKKNTDVKRMVIDYIAGQTDKFFLRECASNLDERFV